MLPFKKNPFETQNRYGGYAAHGYGSDPVARANRMSQNNRAPQNMPQKETDDLGRLKIASEILALKQQMQSEPFMKIPPEIRGFDFSKDYLSRQTGQGNINDGVTYYPPPSNWMQSLNSPQFPSY
jgi:hypothetical protein